MLIALFVTTVVPVSASSTIADGVVAKIENGRVFIRVAHTPYSSISTAAKIMTDKDGAYTLRVESLDDFFTYYIDEIPVTKEQMVEKLRPGMQVAMMENRKREYFLYVSARGLGNHFGHLQRIDGNVITLDREQKGWRKDGGIHPTAQKGGEIDHTGKGEIMLTREQYPNRTVDIELADDAVVLYNGQRVPWQEAGLVADGGTSKPSEAASRNIYVVQAARPHMRVELVPAGWGDWDALVTHYATAGDGWGGREIRNQYLTMATTDTIDKKSFNTRDKATTEKNGGEKLKQTNGFQSYRLAGKNDDEGVGPTWTAIYSKGQSVIVDGFYGTYTKWEQTFVKPGRIMVCFVRRGRITHDRYAISRGGLITYSA
jgi:hypothetical protein